MEDPELQRKILISADPADYPRICEINSIAWELCKDANFWEEKFLYHGCVLIEPQDSIENYLIELDYCRRSLPVIDDTIISLKDRSQQRTLILDTVLHRVDDFAVDGVDRKWLQNIWMKQTSRRTPYFHHFRTVGPVTVRIYYTPVYKKFVLQFRNEVTGTLLHGISEQSLRSLLYVLSYRGYQFNSTTTLSSQFEPHE